jgi:tubulin--tyrosine ligase
MKKIARDAFKAGSKIGGSTDSVFFEIFGLDFILAKKGQPFLLEVNTNPSLEVSCNLLSRIIPELLENTFRLVLDVLFPGKVVPGWAQNFILQNKFSLLTRRKIIKEKQC